MSIKVDFTCLICSKIFKNPFSLPCGDTICEEHLYDPQVLKNNSIKCQSCKETFEVKDNQMLRPNKALQNLIQKELFLSDAEKSNKKVSKLILALLKPLSFKSLVYAILI
jgi:hypothetical protein